MLYRTWLRDLAELAEASLIDCGIMLVLIYVHGRDGLQLQHAKYIKSKLNY